MPFISEVEAIFIQRFYTGWITLRNQLTTPIKLMGRRVIELYDALIAGNDWEVTSFLSLKRRAGHSAWVTLVHSALNMYTWKSVSQGTIPIIDTLGDVEYIQGGAGVIFTKPAGVTSQSGLLGIGNYLYVGNPGFNFKWDGPTGPQGVTNWGIANALTVTGPNTAGAGGNLGVGTSWTNPGDVTGSVGYATVTLASANAKTLTATDFGFSITPGLVIAGIQVTFNGFYTGGTQPNIYVDIIVGGSIVFGSQKLFALPASTASITLGGPTDLWGMANLSPTSANASNFGIGFINQGPSTGAFNIQDVQVTLFVGESISATPTGSGTFSAVNGYSYVYAYGNSSSGEISNATQVSTNTGPFTNVAYVGVGVTASTDPQVNQIRVYRTTDSGGGNQFFEISNSPFPNTTTTIQDTTPDTSLQVTSQAEINLGNTPPPVGLTNMEWFAGRMWGSLANILFASTGPETLSGQAPNSNWNPQFQYVLPGGAIVRNVAGPNGMLVFTFDDCFIVRGTDITNYTVNEFVKDFGVRTYNAVDTDGTNLYVFTSDRQFILVSASGAQDIGLPIGDQLLNVDPSKVYVKVNRYGLDAIVRILDTVNNISYDYNLNQQCWNLPGILQLQACSAVGSVESSPGVWWLVMGYTRSGTSALAYRDLTTFQDVGISYQPNAVFGSIQLADPGTLAKFGACGGFAMQYTNAGTVPTLSILPNDIGCTMTNAVGSQITGTFTNLSLGTNPFPIPPTLGNKPTGYRNLGYYYLLAKGLSAFVQNLQFKLSAPAENTATELIGFGIYGDMKQEVETPGVIPQIQGR